MLCRSEPGHVLHESEDRLVHALVAEHVDSLLYVCKGHVLRRADDYRSFERNVVHEADVDVARSRRHVYEKEVQLAPAYLQDHLLQCIAGHGTTPYERLLGLCEVSYGHPFDTIFLKRHDDFLVAVLECVWHHAFAGCHLWNRRAIYVGVGESDLVAEAGEGDGEVHRYGRLADASLAGSDAYDVLDVCYLFKSEVKAGLLLRSLFLDYGLYLDLGACRGVSYDRRLGAADEVFCEGVAVLGECKGHGYGAVAGLHRLDHSKFNDILVSFRRVLHLLEPLFDAFNHV